MNLPIGLADRFQHLQELLNCFVGTSKELTFTNSLYTLLGKYNALSPPTGNGKLKVRFSATQNTEDIVPLQLFVKCQKYGSIDLVSSIKAFIQASLG